MLDISVFKTHFKKNKNKISENISPRYVKCTCVQDTNRKTNSHFRLAHSVKNTYAACPSGLHQVQGRRKVQKSGGGGLRGMSQVVIQCILEEPVLLVFLPESGGIIAPPPFCPHWFRRP